MNSIRRAQKEYQDLVDNAYNMLKEYYSYEEIRWMPLKDLLAQIKYFTPKFKEIARKREEERLKAELEGKRKLAMQNKEHKNSSRRRK